MDALPKIKVPYRVTRTFVQNHPELIFVYGQDYTNKGCLGQAWQVANEPNSFPVPTLVKLCNSQSDKFFFDDQLQINIAKIDDRIAAIPRDGRPIIVLQKIGQGHSQMKWKAPLTFDYLWQELNKIVYPNIEWDYYG